VVYTQAHSRVHDPAEEAVLACQAEACTYTCRSNAVMKNHVLKAHVKRGPSYACHLCDKLYNREGQLSFYQVYSTTGKTVKLYLVQQEGQLSFSLHLYDKFYCTTGRTVKGTWQRGGFSGVFAEIGSA
jgi:hypothetical protein